MMNSCPRLVREPLPMSFLGRPAGLEPAATGLEEGLNARPFRLSEENSTFQERVSGRTAGRGPAIQPRGCRKHEAPSFLTSLVQSRIRQGETVTRVHVRRSHPQAGGASGPAACLEDA